MRAEVPVTSATNETFNAFSDEYEDGNYDNPHQDKKPTPKSE